MTAAAYKALDMLNLFASVGAQRFDITFTDIDGKKPARGGYLPNRHINGIRPTLGHMLQTTEEQQQNVILRPRASERAELIQLDDLKPELASRLKHRAFMILCTSPDNYQAWVAVSDSEPDFARRLRKGTGADPSASGATRVSGSRNFKRKYGPGPESAVPVGGIFYPTIEITDSNPGLLQTRAELQSAGLVSAKELPVPAVARRVSPTFTGTKKWPSYSRCVQNAPPIHGGDDRPDISRADFTWCLTAIDWGWSIEDTAKQLMLESTKAQENGENYAVMTAQNAAAAVHRRRGGTHAARQ